MTSPCTIRDATRADIGFLVEANAAMAFETEGKRLDRAVLARGVAGVFDDRARGFYLVAERDGVAVGGLLVTREWSDWRDGDWWWIQSVYVVPAARRSGVFRALHAEVEQRARAMADVVGLRLYVEDANANAQATYAALGLVDAHYRLLEAAFTRDASVGCGRGSAEDRG
ncbi:MAG: GNAT family N-acetyltransferase [Xanthomonadales bacterium]|nr:GNAT family N-acetyltransferase [Xanthomonadales bacterium]